MSDAAKISKSSTCLICGLRTTQLVNIFEGRNGGPNLVDVIFEKYNFRAEHDTEKYLCFSCNNWLVNWWSLQSGSQSDNQSHSSTSNSPSKSERNRNRSTNKNEFRIVQQQQQQQQQRQQHEKLSSSSSSSSSSSNPKVPSNCINNLTKSKIELSDYNS